MVWFLSVSRSKQASKVCVYTRGWNILRSAVQLVLAWWVLSVVPSIKISCESDTKVSGKRVGYIHNQSGIGGYIFYEYIQK